MEVPKVHHSKTKSRRSRHKSPAPEHYQNGEASAREKSEANGETGECEVKRSDETASRKAESETGEESTNKTSDHIQKGILGYIDRQIVTQQRKNQSLSDPQGSPAQRSVRSRSSMERSPRMKRSKSESRRRKERKLIAAGEMEVRQANETLMKYLKQCSDVNDASLSGDLEIDKNADVHRHVLRKSRSQKMTGPSFRSVPGLPGNCPARYHHTLNDITAVLDDLGNDVIRQRNTSDIYNPFTPVVSPTDGPPTRIDKMFIQTASGYRSVDTNFYKTSLDGDPEANNWTSVTNSLYLACALQHFWHLLSNICHGLLGGLAMGHLIFVFSTAPHDWSKDTLAHYATFAEVFFSIFYFLAILCVVSVFDRMDLAQISLSNASKTISFRWMVAILPIYLVTVILSLSADSFSDKFYFINYNLTMIEINSPENKVISIWDTLSVARSVGAIVGWILVALSPVDLLYNRLAEMEKYLIN